MYTTIAAATIAEVAGIADTLPAVVIIQNIQRDFTVVWMSNKGLDILQTTNEELRGLAQEYHTRYFEIEDNTFTREKLFQLLHQNDPDHSFSFFLRVCNVKEGGRWDMYLSSTKVFANDSNGNPLLSITLATSMVPSSTITQRVERLLNENELMRSNLNHYALLSKSERKILLLIGKLKTNKQIADELYISIKTVETHKRNIKYKLDIVHNLQTSSNLRKYMS